ncbi:hypothetical protein JTB14_000828 [Gonioctena quinquepunctata]|nr:hypothetical protein JTB14_000828 [Gonioctena quinquepunctata]
MNESKTTSVKTLKIEVNPETGEKYITLNGKKLKIVPESKLPSKIPKNAQVSSINSSTSGSPMKVKILKGTLSKNSNFCITENINKASHTSNSEGNQITREISNINGLSQKTLIKENELQNVKTLSTNITINANTTDNSSHTASMLGNTYITSKIFTNAMELDKYVKKNKYHSETVYCPKSKPVDDKNCSLLGFKNSFPVLNESKTASVKKTLKIEASPETREKYITLNGKKFKIVPESKLLSQITINANTTDNSSHTASKLINQNKSCGSEQSVRALDLTNYSSKENLSQGIPEKMENSSQTDNITEKDKKTVDACVQTDEDSSLDDLIDLHLEDIFMSSFEAPIASEKMLTFSNIPNENLLDLDSLPQQKTKNVVIQSEVAKNLFTESRMALQPDDKGNMPLHIGVITNDLQVVKRSWFILKLLKQSIDLRNNNDYTALQLAIIYNASNDIILFLLMEGASLSTTDNEGNNLVHLSIEFHGKDALAILLSFAEDIGSTLDDYNHEGLTPLMMCCLNGHHQCANLLVSSGADLNIRNRGSGKTALFYAAECHDLEMVQLLLNHQADTRIRNFFGTSPHDAMYEIDDIPDEIKSMILGKNNKRKASDEPRSFKLGKKDKRNKHSVLISPISDYCWT